MTPFDARSCFLGEGAFWHPLRQQFFWFDVLEGRLLSRDASGPLEWRMGRIASAAGWVDQDRLLIATETGLVVLDLITGSQTPLIAVEADTPATRCNDGRADRQGGFWISTMGKAAQPGAGTIWRWYRGTLRPLVEGLTIPNAICFAADGRAAFYTDTPTGKVWRQPLDPQGWPEGGRALYLDLGPMGLNPDGAVIDSTGAFCVACWGAGAVLRFDAQGRLLDRIPVGGRHSSCPALGGAELDQMLVTTAREGIADPDPAQGQTWLVPAPAPGLPEPRIVL